jgi:NAD(P)-dependent dehydrogenase (short-subunit alcohol dehydrogenase family)
MSTGESCFDVGDGQPGRGRLKGKVAVVFGAGSAGPGWGNGKATAVAFAREGALVVGVDFVAAAAEETAAIIRSEGKVCEPYTADVTNSDHIKRVIDGAMETFGRIDILQNNVGLTVMGGPVELSESDWQKQIDTNLKSVYLSCKHTLPIMLAQGKGTIVNVSSIAGIRYTGYPYIGYYAAKGGVNQFTVGLALQYAAQGIRVNAVVPGLMNTPLIQKQIVGQYADGEAMMKQRHAASPTGRMGTAWDVAYASVFLASDEAQYINGVCLPVDGGLHCRAS